MHVGFWCGNLKEGNTLEEQGVSGRVVVAKLGGTMRTGFIWLLIGQAVSCCEQGNQYFGSIIRRGFIE
jgi:hypothetical protein